MANWNNSTAGPGGSPASVVTTAREYALAPGTVIISHTDAEGLIAQANDEFLDASGFARAEVIGKSQRLLRHPDMADAVFSDLWRTIRSGRPWQGVLKNRRADGGYYWAYAGITPVRDGTFISVLVPATSKQIARAEALNAQLGADAKLRLHRGRLPPRGLAAIEAWANNLTLRTRLWAATAVTVCSLLTLVGLGFWLLAQLRAASHVLHFGVASLKLLGIAEWFLWCVGCAALVLWPLAGHWLIGGMTRGLAAANRAARRIADLDLSRPVPVALDNEIGEMLTSIAIMRNNLQESVAALQANVASLGAASVALNSASHGSSGSARVQADASAGIAAAVEQLSVSIDHVGEHACDADEMARAAGAAAAAGAAVVHASADEMDQIASAFNTAANEIHQLQQHSTRISAVVNVIGGVANQTNLLALNAAIEAARAGEQGRGFAVVADEVRQLAERTSLSTQEIGAMVDAVQSGSAEAVRAMRASLDQVSEGVARAHAAGDSINDIFAAAERAADAVAQIRGVLHEQGQAAREIARNVERLAAMTDETLQANGETARIAAEVDLLAQAVNNVVRRYRV